MIYVEYLRVRTSLAWHAGILAALTLLVLATNHSTSVIVNGHPAVTTGARISLAVLAPIAAFFGAIYASSAGTSLNRENSTRDISWTKPVSRTMLALQYVLVDLAGIALAFTIAMLAVYAVVVRMGVVPVIEESLVPQLALALGIATMWYALIQLLTFWFGPAARAVGGILWPVALVCLGIAGVPGLYGALARAINIINPLAYLSNFSVNGNGGHTHTLWTLPAEMRTVVVWLFTVLFCAIAITFWRRKEA
jgi:hypothetical protein